MPPRRRMPRRPAARLTRAQIARATPARSRVFLRHLREDLREAPWRDHRRTLLHQFAQFEARWLDEIALLEASLRSRRAQLALVPELHALLRDPHAAASARRRKPRGGGGRNAAIVVQALQSLGGEARAAAIVLAVKRHHPEFGGRSFRTQIYQILRTDPRIERLARGRYRLRRG